MIASDIEIIRKNKQYNIDGGVEAKLNLHTNNYIFDMHLNHFLKSDEFYKVLFYDDVYLAEGLTEKLVIRQIKNDIENSVYFFSTSGKAYIPIFAWLFNMISKSVKIIIDSDRRGGTYKTQVAITEYLQEKYNENLRVFEHDFESHFDINASGFRQKYSVHKDLSKKPIVAQEYFSEQSNKQRFLNFLTTDN